MADREVRLVVVAMVDASDPKLCGRDCAGLGQWRNKCLITREKLRLQGPERLRTEACLSSEAKETS